MNYSNIKDIILTEEDLAYLQAIDEQTSDRCSQCLHPLDNGESVKDSGLCSVCFNWG